MKFARIAAMAATVTLVAGAAIPNVQADKRSPLEADADANLNILNAIKADLGLDINAKRSPLEADADANLNILNAIKADLGLNIDAKRSPLEADADANLNILNAIKADLGLDIDV